MMLTGTGSPMRMRDKRHRSVYANGDHAPDGDVVASVISSP